jgi:hypothetical protein
MPVRAEQDSLPAQHGDTQVEIEMIKDRKPGGQFQTDVAQRSTNASLSEDRRWC